MSKAQATPQLRAWSWDFGREYTLRSCVARFGDLELALEQRLPYLANRKVDSMFLPGRVTHDRKSSRSRRQQGTV